jgi:hypothetical protein
MGLLGVLATLFAAVRASAQEPPPLANDEQIMVKQAIQNGVRYITARQNPVDGSFPGPGHPVGITALAGLALMESGMDAQDPSTRAAASYVLKGLTTLDDTYDLSLAILFLDRYGHDRYKSQIQMLACRLIGGQTTTGGWSYKCPLFNKRDQAQLLDVLRKLEKFDKAVGDGGKPVAGGGKDERLPGVAAGGKDAEEKGSAASGARRDVQAQAQLPRPGMCIKAADSPDTVSAAREEDSAKPRAGQAKPPVAGAQIQNNPSRVTIPGGALAWLPVLQDPLGEVDPRGHPDRPVASKDPKSVTDNSNTQFAILAMWAAKHHGVPTDRTLKLIVRRFRDSQNLDGGWIYSYVKGGSGDSTPAMTCAGLAGLAVGFGLSGQKGPANKADEQLVKKGFRRLMTFIGQPSEKFEKRVPLDDNHNLYYLWSIERVAVMYNLPTLGNRDWYRWGVEILVTNQEKIGPHAGAWVNGGFSVLNDPNGSWAVVNTSLALLFLRGANLTSDLTASLPIDPVELNKELAGINPERLKPKTPGKSGRDVLDTRDDEKTEVAPLPVPNQPEKAESQPAPQPVLPPPSTTTTAATEKKSDSDNKGMMIAIFAVVAVVVIAGVGAAIYFVTRGGKKTDEDEEDVKSRRGQRGRRPVHDDEEARPAARRPPPSTRAAGKKVRRARYDDDDEDDD